MKTKSVTALLCAVALLLCCLFFSGFAYAAEEALPPDYAPCLLPLKTTPQKVSHGIGCLWYLIVFAVIMAVGVLLNRRKAS